MSTNDDNDLLRVNEMYDEYYEYGEEDIDERHSIHYPFNILSREAKQLYLTNTITILSTPPNSLQFYREYIAANKPVIIKNAFNNCNALKSWNNNYLRSVIGDKEITVDIDPFGLADSVY